MRTIHASVHVAPIHYYYQTVSKSRSRKTWPTVVQHSKLNTDCLLRIDVEIIQSSFLPVLTHWCDLASRSRPWIQTSMSILYMPCITVMPSLNVIAYIRSEIYCYTIIPFTLTLQYKEVKHLSSLTCSCDLE